MAEGNPDPGKPSARRKSSPTASSSASDEEADVLKPDLGLGEQPSFERRAETSADLPKREENPFSFKHFLRRETGGSSTGARRKVYPEERMSPPSCYVPDAEMYAPELASALPDFVQDHLVVEQCFGHQEQLPDFAQRLERLPDFALAGGDGLEHCFALGEQRLPDFTRADALPDFTPRADTLPDFTPRADALPDFTPRAEREETAAVDTEMVGALPDFLLHRAEPPTEAEMLRRELDTARRALATQTLRVAALESEVRALGAGQRREAAERQKALEQVEDDLKRCTRRAVTAENTVSNLKQEIKLLKLQPGATGAGAAWTGAADAVTARSLRGAAATAEAALRTLLAGVGDLRNIADSLDPPPPPPRPR